MQQHLHTYRDTHAVRNSAEYELKQLSEISKRRHMRGSKDKVHESSTPVDAYLNQNRWVVNCYCSSGCVVDEDGEKPIARCFGCGAVHTNVAFPPEREEIESVILKRRQLWTRNWDLGETVDQLVAENLEHGIS